MAIATRITMIGAGNVGGNLGTRFSQMGLSVQFGVRNPAEAESVLAGCKGATSSSVKEAAAWGDIVFLAVPGSVAVETAQSVAKQLEGKVVVDCTNPLVWNLGPVWAPPREGSNAAAIAAVARGARVVKGFNTFGAEFHKDPNFAGPPAEVFLAGDDAEAKRRVSEVAAHAGFRPVDAGPLRNAAVVENLAVLWIHLAMVGGQGRTFAFALQKRH